MIEAPEGLENVEAIAEVQGIDVLHLGANDLLAALGKPGQFDDPVLAEAQARVLKAARQNGKFAGCAGIRDVDRQIQAIRQGYQFLTTQTDIGFISGAASQWVQTIRKATPA
jgi:2-keto-3-deoxy-L-rhamnonate aldolase RhmA